MTNNHNSKSILSVYSIIAVKLKVIMFNTVIM